MSRTNLHQVGPQSLRHFGALLGVVLIIITALGLAHCSYDHGMSPDFCAMMLVATILAALMDPLLSGWVPSDAAPALVPVTPPLFDRPPRISRS